MARPQPPAARPQSCLLTRPAQSPCCGVPPGGRSGRPEGGRGDTGSLQGVLGVRRARPQHGMQCTSSAERIRRVRSPCLRPPKPLPTAHPYLSDAVCNACDDLRLHRVHAGTGERGPRAVIWERVHGVWGGWPPNEAHPCDRAAAAAAAALGGMRSPPPVRRTRPGSMAAAASASCREAPAATGAGARAAPAGASATAAVAMPPATVPPCCGFNGLVRKPQAANNASTTGRSRGTGAVLARANRPLR
jgi:hypothetical protein